MGSAQYGVPFQAEARELMCNKENLRQGFSSLTVSG